MTAEKPFIPKMFQVKERVEGEGFLLRKLMASDLEIDYAAVVASGAIIHQLRSGSWPDETFTKEEDAIDLGWHQREFEFRSSFAYIVTSANGSAYLGCVYIYPTDKPWIVAPEKTEAVVNMWVTQDAFDAGFYPKLFAFVQHWISTDWPFTNVFYSNREKPPVSGK